MSKLIVVIGATGKQGGSVIKHLQKQGNWKLRGITRDSNSARAKELAEQGVEIVSCNMSNKEALAEAFKGAYGVFGVTTPGRFGSVDHEKELTEGLNLVEAAVKNNVQHFVFSSLDDVTKASGGKISVPHFTNKNKVEQEARKTNIPFKTFVYPPFFADNLPGMMFRLNEDRASAMIFAGVNTDRKLPVFGVDDLGIVVSEVFKHPENYNGRKLLTAGDYVSLKEMADICTTVLNVPTQYVAMDAETVGQRMGSEAKNMFMYFNECGYYQDNEQQAVKEARELFPGLLTFEQYVEKNSQLFLK
ncbi:predicted protein [Naegleria gruberi]|uniref:Predicted protein n=1 Tax=Naegleria gruberi TaxID=5762 RepID=D2W1R3_NAEGR|nr:uncharacterized protein NAEGRDRAFT_75347 [Naegleria gruberi]EFC37011.1 predicted protein [Naegleria gruberi]|eukprot:XP_002669755.1 predicted protein [Naegleria gruberi strain NEG-M]